MVDILKEAATFISSSATATGLVQMLGCICAQQAKDAWYHMLGGKGTHGFMCTALTLGLRGLSKARPASTVL